MELDVSDESVDDVALDVWVELVPNDGGSSNDGIDENDGDERRSFDAIIAIAMPRWESRAAGAAGPPAGCGPR